MHDKSFGFLFFLVGMGVGRYGFLKIVTPNDCFESTKMVFSEIGLCFHNHQLVVPNIFGLAMNPQQSRRCWTHLFNSIRSHVFYYVIN